MIRAGDVIGAVDRCDGREIKGWARSSSPDNVVILELLIDDIKVRNVKCDQYRPDLETVQKDGRCAFSIRISEQARGQIPASAGVRLQLAGTKELFHEGVINGSSTASRFKGVDGGGHKLSLNKNGVMLPLLGDRDDDYLDGLLDFTLDVAAIIDQSFGYPAFITYGTLLGAARAADVIPHDDDVDLAVFIPADSATDLEEKVDMLVRGLAADGLKTSKLNPTQFHVYREGYWLDIFVAWTIDEAFYMCFAMNGELTANQVFPLSSIGIRGREMPAPMDPDLFLTTLYGEAWRQPNPFFDWAREDVWGKLPDEWKHLLDPLKKTTEYWEGYYRNSSGVPNWPSQFACFFLDEMNAVQQGQPTIVDVGCGNGRDSFFFADRGFRVIGVDGCIEVIKTNSARDAMNADFIRCNFNDIGSVTDTIDALSGHEDIFLYSRFFVHAIDDHAEDLLIKLCDNLSTRCSMAAFEFRIRGDEEGDKETTPHFRRFTDHDVFVSKLEAVGFRKCYEATGRGYAKYKTDDALVCRLLFSPRDMGNELSG